MQYLMVTRLQYYTDSRGPGATAQAAGPVEQCKKKAHEHGIVGQLMPGMTANEWSWLRQARHHMSCGTELTPIVAMCSLP